MKKPTIILTAILFMVIGYAAYNATVNIYGNGKIAENLNDFKIYLSSLKVNGTAASGINDAKDEFTINDINGDVTIDIVNDSTEYDTEAYLECVKEDENVGKTWEFDYTGGEQTFTVPLSGIYKLETWGASGGTVDVSYYGGYGGYSKGNITQTKGNLMYINVGGKGTGAISAGESLTGGYNGGGDVTGSSTVNHITASGGGATHIASLSGLLSTLENNKSNIFIVSGGGGGGRNQSNHTAAARWGLGGSGGGMTGGGPKSSLGGTTSYTTVPDLAGTQTSGYAFGQGESVSIQSAGGGGFYGGYSGSNKRSPYTGSGAGGSGYIGNSLLTEKSMYCYECTESDEANTKTIDTTCTNSEPTENCAKIGNGYARVTLVDSTNDFTTDKNIVEALSTSTQKMENIKAKSLTCKLKVNKISRTEKKTYNGPTIWNYDYTGGEQTFTAPVTGTYKLETWGASGGCALNNGVTNCTKISYGGYSSGTTFLTAGNTLYINVGGKGTDGILKSNSPGGYNGGGYGTWDNSDDESAGGGGGATHIATSSGLLSTLENTKSSILIVSGGGGGQSWTYLSGSGGGYKGVTTSTTNQSEVSQTNGYSFGQGQDAKGTASSDGVGGGGGGFYGGYMNNVGSKSSGSGGSGYIGNTLLTNKSMYCYNCSESTEESTKTISTTCTSTTPTSNCAKAGNGYARITLISRN